jgi:Uma2 family endonuclease
MPLISESGLRLFRVEDLEHLPSQVPSGPVRYELHNGILVALPPHTDQHGAVLSHVAAELLVQGQQRGFGKARSVGPAVILRRDPDHVLVPDAVFIANRQLPIRKSPEDYLETIPALIVEVRSTNETLDSLLHRAEDYVNAGTVVVWVVDPINRNVVEYRQGVTAKTYDENDTLTVDDIIPGFALPVREALQE